ncbi:hypothetical protein LPJ61_005529, partial [Coemansia biformis]
YNGTRAILKLMWTPNNRLPEPAVYDVLIQAGVQHIPEVYDSGTVIEDSFGYQIDYLLIEDAGVLLAEYIGSLNSLGTAGKCNAAAEITQKVLDCLVQARQAGVLHHDISTGNIAVCNGKLVVIDWGYAKLVEDDGRGNSCTGSSVDDLARKWRFDKEIVMKNEDKHDPITGTPRYMSILILVGAHQCSITDDAESALYILLEAAFKYLFEWDGKYIGTYLSIVTNFECSTNVEQLEAIATANSDQGKATADSDWSKATADSDQGKATADSDWSKATADSDRGKATSTPDPNEVASTSDWTPKQTELHAELHTKCKESALKGSLTYSAKVKRLVAVLNAAQLRDMRSRAYWPQDDAVTMVVSGLSGRISNSGNDLVRAGSTLSHYMPCMQC